LSASAAVRLREAPTLADADAASAQHLRRHSDAELGVFTRASFHDEAPRVGYKTVRVIAFPP
jgi:hypothetical protein